MNKTLLNADPVQTAHGDASQTTLAESLIKQIDSLQSELAVERTARETLRHNHTLLLRALDVAPTEFTISSMAEQSKSMESLIKQIEGLQAELANERAAHETLQSNYVLLLHALEVSPIESIHSNMANMAEQGKTTQSLIKKLENLQSELTVERTEHETLRHNHALLLRALDVAPTEFTISNMAAPISIILYCNKARADNLGYPKEEIVGQPLTRFFAKPNSEERHALLRSKLMKKETVRNETVALRKDGSTYHRGSTVIPLLDEQGNVTHCVSIGADITARLEAERRQRELQEQLVNEMEERERIAIELRLAQKLESVGRLAAGVAHEINTPIQFVSDSLYFLSSSFEDLRTMITAFRDAHTRVSADQNVPQLLQDVESAIAKADLDFVLDEVPRAFERTFEGTTRVANIVRAMKEFAHPDTVEHSPADINHALQTTLTVAANEYKYTASVKTDFGDIPSVVCNVGELNQVFLNMIVNAAHAIHDAGKDVSNGEIHIATRQVDDAVEITFTDNGCGIPKEHLDKIYDPFFTTKEVGRGTGQGLAITRSIVVEKHGGDVQASSTVGAGTKFVLRLPINGKKGATQEDAIQEG